MVYLDELSSDAHRDALSPYLTRIKRVNPDLAALGITQSTGSGLIETLSVMQHIFREECGLDIDGFENLGYRLVEFLQIVSLGSYQFQRFPPETSENTLRLTPETLNEVLSNQTLPAVRGGNRRALEASVGVLFTLASRFALKGGKAVKFGFDAMFAPAAGLTGCDPTGFPSPDASLFLSLVWPKAREVRQVPVRPILPENLNIGRKVIANVDSFYVKFQNTVMSFDGTPQDTIKSLAGASTRLLIPSEQLQSAKRVLPVMKQYGFERFSLQNSIMLTATEGFGMAIKESFLKEQFIQEAYIRAGLAPTNRGDAHDPTMTAPMTNPVFKIGKYSLSYRLDGPLFISKYRVGPGEPGYVERVAGNSYVYCLESKSSDGRFTKTFEWSERYNPFLGRRTADPASGDMFQMFGCSMDGGLGKKDFKKVFSPVARSHRAEDVIEILKKMKRKGAPQSDKVAVLKGMGIDSGDAAKMVNQEYLIPVIEQLSEIEEYAGVPPDLACIDAGPGSRLDELIKVMAHGASRDEEAKATETEEYSAYHSLVADHPQARALIMKQMSSLIYKVIDWDYTAESQAIYSRVRLPGFTIR
jgi:hypothetical protein